MILKIILKFIFNNKLLLMGITAISKRYKSICRVLRNFEENGSAEFKHDLKSFNQGIKSNVISCWILFILKMLFEMVLCKHKDIYREGDVCFKNIIYLGAICIVIPYTLYTITEVKHLSENIGKINIENFLRKYVLYGVISLLFECTFMVIVMQHISWVYVPLIIVIIMLIFILGMADILNNYKKNKFQEIKNLFNYLKKYEYRKQCNEALKYNIKAIYAGLKRFIILKA